MTLLGYVSGLGYGLICLLLALVLYKLGMPKPYTRKVVHILVGFEWIFLYNFLGAGIHFLIVCLLFLALLIVAFFAKLLPMISSDDDNSPGTVYYAVAMTGVSIVGCFVPEVMLPFGIGIFSTSIGDGCAGLFGQLITNYNPKLYRKKSLWGTVINFAASALSALIMSLVFAMGLSVFDIIAIGLVSSLYELIVGRGFDNIAVTWGVTALAYAFMYYPTIYNYIIPIILTPIVVIFAEKKRALSLSGLIAAIALDVVVTLTLGNFGFILLLSFFVFGILLDKIKKRIKSLPENVEAKGETRDAFQVFANGLVAALAAVLYLSSRNRIFLVGFVAALGEALADTAGSSLGAMAKRAFDPFRFKSCEGGISGGMSVIGTLSSLVFALVIPLLAFGVGIVNIYGMLIAWGVAFLGSLIDSMLGSLLQVKYKCSLCGKITEKPIHCDKRAEKFSGISFIDNDAVNLLSGLASAVISILLAWSSMLV